jgi:hypothetical protein
MPENYAAVPHVKDAKKRLKRAKKLTTGKDGGG